MLSTGEGAAVSYSEDAGIRARIITIRGLPFGNDDDKTRQLVDTVNESVKANYGHAGPLFVKWLLDNKPRWDEFRQKYAQLKSNYRGKSGTASRIGSMAAVIDLAGELFHEGLSLPWPFESPFPALWASIEADIVQIDIDVRAMSHVASWACSNEESFWGRHGIQTRRVGENYVEDPKTPSRGWSGRWDGGGKWQYIGFYPHMLREVLEDAGYKDIDAIISGWKQRGWLDAPLPNTCTKVVKVRSTSTRVIAIRREPLKELGLLHTESIREAMEDI